MSDKDSARWSRVLLKVSGEAFAGDAGYGIDGEIVTRIAKEIVDVRETFNVDIAVVVGGGNIWRGMSGAGAAAWIEHKLITWACSQHPLTL